MAIDHSSSGHFFSGDNSTSSAPRARPSPRTLETNVSWIGNAAAAIPRSALDAVGHEALARASDESATWQQQSDIAAYKLPERL